MHGTVVLVSICGMSGSGKSTLAHSVQHALGANSCTILSVDNYYKDLSYMDPQLRDMVNFDDPDAIDKDMFGNHLRALRAGQAVEMPMYEFKSHTRLPKVTIVEPAPFILVEGIFTLSWEELNALWDLSIWLSVEPTLAIQRIIDRDEVERGWSPKQSRDRFEEVVFPSYKRYIEAAEKWANLHLNGSEDLLLLTSQVIKELLVIPSWGKRSATVP